MHLKEAVRTLHPLEWKGEEPFSHPDGRKLQHRKLEKKTTTVEKREDNAVSPSEGRNRIFLM